MPKDADKPQPSGSQPSGKASAEKIRADLHAAGLMRLLDTPPEKGARIVRRPGSNVIPFRRLDAKIPVRRPPPVRATWHPAHWKRPVASALYLLLTAAIAYLFFSGWNA